MYLCIKHNGFCTGCAACSHGFVTDDSFAEGNKKKKGRAVRRALLGTLTGEDWYINAERMGGGELGKAYKEGR